MSGTRATPRATHGEVSGTGMLDVGERTVPGPAPAGPGAGPGQRHASEAGAGCRTWEQADPADGPAREVSLVAEVAEVDLGPLGVHRRWVYNGQFPGPELRVRAGDRLRVLLGNGLPEEPRITTGREMGMMGGMPTGPEYEAFLTNGRPPEDPPLIEVARGERIRLRLMNPAMGERYDVAVEADNPGAWNLVAAAMDPQSGSARAILRYRETREARPPEGQAPAGLERGARLLGLTDLRSIELDGSSRSGPAHDPGG